ncbi:MAG: oligosaccharide flippase family protein [Candidatus Omnitrophica bacterium]|nr:oligosaccharide flippase family protein [Candidatus Omnitrophota bacterium]
MKSLPQLKDIFGLFTSKWLAQLINLCAGFITARILGPRDFGLWSTLGMVFTYGYLSDLGVLAAIKRQIPYLKAQDKPEEVIATINTGFSLFFIFTLIAAILIFFLPAFVVLDYPLITGLRISALIFVILQLFFFLKAICLAEGRFILQSKSEILYNIIYFFCLIIFIRNFRIYGLFFSMFLSGLITIVYLFHSTGLRLYFQIYLKHLSLILKLGIQFFINTVLFTIYSTIDKLLVIIFLLRYDLGIYSIAVLPLSLVHLYSQAINESFSPYATIRYTLFQNSPEFKSYLIHILRLLSYSLPIVIGFSWLLLEPLIKYFLPVYIPAINPARTIIFSCFFSSLSSIVGLYLSASGKPYKGIPFLAFGIIFNFSLGYLFIRFGWGIEGVALSVLITSFLWAIIFSIFLFRELRMNFMVSVSEQIKLYWPICFMATALFFLDKISVFIIRILIFSFFITPLLLLTLKQKKEFSKILLRETNG